MTKNRAKDSAVAREASDGTSSDNSTWNNVAEIMDDEKTDVQDAWVKNWRRNNSWGIFLAAGLTASAIAALMGGSALAATVCPEGSEVLTIDGADYCQPTQPLTFEKEDDRGSGRLVKSRDEFPKKRCGSGGATKAVGDYHSSEHAALRQRRDRTDLLMGLAE